MGAISQAPRRPGVVEDTGMCGRSLRGNRETPRPTIGTLPIWSASGRRGAVADDARTWGVKLRHSSCEADEQSGATRCGAGGAKGGDQGVPRVSPERAARSPFSMQRYVAPWAISVCAISPRSAATMSSCRDKFHHSLRHSSGATRIVCMRNPSTLPSHDLSYSGSEQFEFVLDQSCHDLNLSLQSLARAGVTCRHHLGKSLSEPVSNVTP